MIKIEMDLDNELLDALQSQLRYIVGDNGKFVAPTTMAAFAESARLVQRMWQEWANGGSIDGADDIKSPSPLLAQSIKIDRRGDFDYSVYTDSPEMERVQNGRKAQDMKLTYPFGRKSRVSKQNVPYLIIPFRWGTPNKSGGKRAHFSNVMTKDIHSLMKSKKFKGSSRTDKTHAEKNAMGEDIARSEYSWGDSLSAEGNANGMVKMSNSGGGSSYFTFRVISMNSKPESWWKKEIPPNDVLGALERQVRDNVQARIQAAIEFDMEQ